MRDRRPPVKPVYLCAKGAELPQQQMSDLEVAWHDLRACRVAHEEALGLLATYTSDARPQDLLQARAKHSEAVERVEHARARLTLLSRQAVGAIPHELPEENHR